MKTFYGLLLIMLSLIFYRCTKDVAGSNDETVTGISTSTMLYNPDGTPSVGAVVKIFKVTDTTKTPVLEKVTDQNGYYSLTELPAGTYNGYAKNNTLVAFQDSICVLTDTILVRKDTLETPRSITGIIGLQPKDPLNSATVQVLGTNIYSNVNDFGYFTLDQMAQGDFTFKLSTTLQNYTTTYEKFTIDLNTPDTIADTFEIIYSGIPVVVGMVAEYDTLNGVVSLSWNKTKYPNIENYVVYRTDYDSLNWPTKEIGHTSDTIYQDSIFKRSIVSGEFSFSDTNDYHVKYKVIIMNNSGQKGLHYKYVNTIAASPTKVKTSFSFTIKHIKKGIQTDSSSINDSLQIVASFSNPTRTIRKISWAIGYIDSIKQVKIFDSINIAKPDTLVYLWNSIGNHSVFLLAEDDDSIIWTDTTIVYSVKDVPTPTASTTTPTVSINNSIRLQGTATDVYGTIVKWEWDAGNSGTFVETTPDSNYTPIAPSTSNSAYPCVLKVTDDDGCIGVDTISISVFGMVIDIDGNIYQTTKIGNQIWTVENLRTTKYNDGTAIPNIIDTDEWTSTNDGAFCYYNNDENNKEKYGALYNWYAVNTGKLAPVGWHVPSHAEWDTLVDYLIANGYNWDGTTIGNKTGKSVATKTDWWISNKTGAVGNDLPSNNSSYFSAIPVGTIYTNGFEPIGSRSSWFSTTPNPNMIGIAWSGYVKYDDSKLTIVGMPMSVGSSIRLLRD